MTSSSYRENNMLRLNVINRDNEFNRISIIISARTPISKLKRKIEQQYAELYNISILVSTIQDGNGFAISNNSTIGQHVVSNQTIYIDVHHDKTGSNMNLAADISDIFLTLRYVSASVVDKIEKIQISEQSIIEVIPEIMHLGFWYSNIDVVRKACQFLNKIFGPKQAQHFSVYSQQIHNVLLLKLLNFWFIDVQNSFTVFPDVCWELLQLLEKLTCNQKYAQLLKNTPIIKTVTLLSKNEQNSGQIKKTAMRIVKNVTGGGKKGMIQKTKSSYIPSMLNNNQYAENDIEQVLEMLSSGNDDKIRALDLLSEQKNGVLVECTVRFEHYSRLLNIFSIKNLKGRTQLIKFNKTVQLLTKNTSKQKSIEVMQKDVLKRIHGCLLDCPQETHQAIIEFCQKIINDAINASMLNIEQCCELIFSPYQRFQRMITAGLCAMSESNKKVNKIRFIPGIRDLIRLSLKSQSEDLILNCLRTISNICLDEQCRYQVMNLKGVQLFVQYLETSTSVEIQRVCSKGLLNLSIASREVKVKVLATMTGAIEKYYRKEYDPITEGFIQTLMKSPKV